MTERAPAECSCADDMGPEDEVCAYCNGELCDDDGRPFEGWMGCPLCDGHGQLSIADMWVLASAGFEEFLNGAFNSQEASS